MNFVIQNKLPIQFVRLDTEESRHVASTGKFFQITSVPTMAVFYEDGNTQLFTGTQKIIQWLTAMIKASTAASQSRGSAAAQAEPPNMYGPSNGGARRSLVPLVQKPRKPQIDEGEDMNMEDDDDAIAPPQMRAAPRQPPRAAPRRIPTPVVEEDDGGDEEEPDEIEIDDAPAPPVPKVRKPRAKSSKKAPKPRKSRAKPKPVDEDDEVELVDADADADPRRQAREKLNAVATAKSKPSPSRMKNLYAAAKQMEQDRDASLGYNEAELPHF